MTQALRHGRPSAPRRGRTIARSLGVGAALAAALGAGPALAHHPLDGAPMETVAHGLLSGVGHPVLGFDHLFFVAAAGVAAALAGARWTGPGAYVAMMLAGCALMAAGVGLPAREAAIALSLVAVGGIVASGRTAGAPATLALLAAFGLFHGSAFGEAIAGQEGGSGGAVLGGYLLGLGATQYLVALGAGLAVTRLAGGMAASAPGARVAGALAAGAGMLLALEAAEGPALAALGLG